MATEKQTPKLLTRANQARCQYCPPERVCAWTCVQGAGSADILVGAVLEQSTSWALQAPEPGLEAVRQGLWDTFNS
jgi:hypothetical protein